MSLVLQSRYFRKTGMISLAALLSSVSSLTTFAACEPDFPEGPALSRHFEQQDIVSRQTGLDPIFRKGEELFITKMNKCDGQGRPATTGAGAKRVPDQPSLIRTSAPDANACVGCHNQPEEGGAGDFVANVFVLAQALDPVTESVSSEFSNERNTLGMHGAGPIEMLAREMTVELKRKAAQLPDGTHDISTKGVSFRIVKRNGDVVESEGVDKDLIIKPFHQSGVVVSIREFSVNAMNHHHGMQAEERFDLNPEKNFEEDFDEDGVGRELTVGDITALTLYQAMLPTPMQTLPRSKGDIARIKTGERLFGDIGCASCHVPSMTVDNRNFVEPNPFNPPGTFKDERSGFSFDMTEEGRGRRLEKHGRRGAVIRAYTDLKRHNLCDPEGTADAIRFYCNENLPQGRSPHGDHPGQEYFITRKLWDVGSSAPYGHRGDLSTIAEAILYHGGEARLSRDRFVTLGRYEQAKIVDFLKTLTVTAEPEKNHR